jgi:hypothetical protein
MTLMQALRISRESVKAAKELARKREAILAMEVRPLNYGILEDLMSEVARRGRDVEVSVRLQNGDLIQIKAPDPYDAHKAQEEIEREFWAKG